jgi:hypothetical protein
MSYPKIIEENLYALNKEKKFESHVPKINFLSKNKVKKNDILFHKKKIPKENFAFVTPNTQSRRCSHEVQNHIHEQINTLSILTPVVTHAGSF